MIKQNQGKLNTLHIINDIICSVISIVVSYYLSKCWFNNDILSVPYISTAVFVFVIAFTAIMQILCNKFCDLYRSYRSSRFVFEVTNIIKSGIAMFVILMTAAIITSTLFVFQIAIILYFFIYSMIAVLYRFLLRRILRLVRSKGYNKKYIVFLGINDCTESLIKKIRSSPDLGYEIAGYFDGSVQQISGIGYLGDFKGVSRFFEKCKIDEAIIMLPDKEQKLTEKMVSLCENWGIKFSIIPNIFSTFSSRIYISSFDGMPVLSMRKVPLDNAFNSFIKRVFDIVIASVMLIVLSPLMAVVAIIIKATSPGHIIFKQERVGLGRKPFIMYKFRSMREDTEGDLSMTEKNDPRCTKIGHFIRKYSIDELPQLLNVLKGDMSLVGPRPEIPFYVQQFRKSVPLYMVKHYVKPGMTGWAQVNGLRGNDTSIEERIKYDIYYIENWSVAFDIKILFKTLFKGIFSKNAH
ncbi:MAG: undecaprenyl-phosphate glucose phosphotransferase [Acutalibacteraceae bacterium]